MKVTAVKSVRKRSPSKTDNHFKSTGFLQDKNCFYSNQFKPKFEDLIKLPDFKYSKYQ